MAQKNRFVAFAAIGILFFGAGFLVLSIQPDSASAASSQPLLGGIALAGFDFAPRGWAQCNGQVLAISQNPALFALLGTKYGGNGTTTFGLPDLRGRTAIGYGQGPGLSSFDWGQKGGKEQHTLQIFNVAQLPPPAAGTAVTELVRASGQAAVDTRDPYLALNYIIATQGVFPSRN